VVSDERAGPVSALTPSNDATRPTQLTDGQSQVRSASFEVGGFRVELTARGGAVTLAVAAGEARGTYLIDPETLDRWADGTGRLLALSPASGPGERADYRAPFLMDAEGRAALAFESVVTERGVAHRLLVMGQGGRVAALAATVDTLSDLIAAARGAVAFARAR